MVGLPQRRRGHSRPEPRSRHQELHRARHRAGLLVERLPRAAERLGDAGRRPRDVEFSGKSSSGVRLVSWFLRPPSDLVDPTRHRVVLEPMSRVGKMHLGVVEGVLRRDVVALTRNYAAAALPKPRFVKPRQSAGESSLGPAHEPHGPSRVRSDRGLSSRHQRVEEEMHERVHRVADGKRRAKIRVAVRARRGPSVVAGAGVHVALRVGPRKSLGLGLGHRDGR
mmetsp:Transcript_29644/g.91676  ORF Transcript_29644/g.91676 Transcript_29644/m.91676 type:complete len:224 (-) Transcript_29644:1302-1973(-)